MNKPLPYVVLTNHDECVDRLQQTLRCAGLGSLQVRWVDSTAALQTVLAVDRPCFLAIEVSADQESVGLIQLVRRLAPTVPIVVLCDPQHEQAGIDALDAGADDYLLQDNLLRLGPLVRRWARRRSFSDSVPSGEPEQLEPSLLGDLYHGSSDCIAFFEVRSPRRFVLVGLNPAGERRFELRAANVLGKTPHEIWPPHIADSLLRNFQAAIESAVPTTAELAWPLASGCRWFHGVHIPVRYPGQPAHRLAVVWRDITVRKAFEEALCDREEMFRRLVETTNVIPWEADFHSQRFTYVGPQAVKRFGYPATEWYEEGFWLRHVHPEDRNRVSARMSLAKGEYEFTYRMLTSDEAVVWVQDVVNVVFDQGRLLLRGFFVDVTARRRAEEEVRRLNNELEQRVIERTQQLAAANKELEAFCYSVSHDLRAPLRAIDGFSKALLEDCGDCLNADGHDALRRVRAASQRMGELIDDLLTLSRVTRTEMQKVHVPLSEMALAIKTVLQSLDPHREVEWIIAPGLSANGDPTLLRVVLENLLGNAWKYTSKHERARIEFGCEPMACPGKVGPELVFFVRDDGAGFDLAYAGRLFQPFQRPHRPDEFEGHGIGVATVQRIIHRHGGQVWADGAVEQGATFFFTL